MTISIHYNGIKAAKGAKLEKAFYSMYENGSVSGKYPAGTICVTAKGYNHFSTAIVEALGEAQNDSDSQTDYFDNDRIRVLPSHPMHAQLVAAIKAGEARWEAKEAKRLAKRR